MGGIPNREISARNANDAGTKEGGICIGESGNVVGDGAIIYRAIELKCLDEKFADDFQGR